MPPCPRPLSLLERCSLHKRRPCNPTPPTLTAPASPLANLPDTPVKWQTKTPSYPTSTPAANSRRTSPPFSILSPVPKITTHSPISTEDLPSNYLNMHATSWSSTFTHENPSTHFVNNQNSTNSPMSPSTSRFESTKLIYHHSNMATRVLVPKNHPSSSRTTTPQDHEKIPSSLAKTTPCYHIPPLSLASTFDFEQEVESELVLMAIYELYGT